MAISRGISFCCAALVAAFAIVPKLASAWDGSVTGSIAAIDITAGSNYGFRVYLNGIGNMCTGGPNWAFLNSLDSNYNAYVAALMMAKAQSTRVNIYSTLEGGYCHIGYISVLSN
jgi:hypothetical protein